MAPRIVPGPASCVPSSPRSATTTSTSCSPPGRRTGATIEATTRMALARGARPQVTVVATHGLLVGDATERLHALPLNRLVVTDTTSLPAGPPSWVDVRSVDVLLGEAIDRLHRDRPLDELLLHT